MKSKDEKQKVGKKETLKKNINGSKSRSEWLAGLPMALATLNEVTYTT